MAAENLSSGVNLQQLNLANGNLAIAGDKPQDPNAGKSSNDDGLVSADSNEQQITPKHKRHRDPVQAARGEEERKAAAEGKADPMPFIDPEIDELPDNSPDDPGDETEDEEDEVEVPVGGEAEFDEDLYARAVNAGLSESRIEEFLKTPDRLERVVSRIEERREESERRRTENRTQTASEPEEKPATFDRQKMMEKYELKEDDPLLVELEEGFNARQAQDKRLAALEKNERDNQRKLEVAELDGIFGSKDVIDNYGELFGGDSPMGEMEANSREAKRRKAIWREAMDEARMDQQLGRRLKTKKQYILEAMDSLHGGEKSAGMTEERRLKLSEKAKNQLKNREGQFIKRGNTRQLPAEPETGDEAARKNIREKMGFKGEDSAAFQAVQDSLL